MSGHVSSISPSFRRFELDAICSGTRRSHGGLDKYMRPQARCLCWVSCCLRTSRCYGLRKTTTAAVAQGTAEPRGECSQCIRDRAVVVACS